MNISEAIIRDKLSTNLQILEVGLTHVDSEHYLPNNAGANGFVDLLARDIYGTLVLIEIKKSDCSARQAIHELFKYIALLGQRYRLDKSRLRCVVVSTHWHELLVPFSEFKETVDYDVSGYEIKIDDNGNVVNAYLVQNNCDKFEGERLSPYHQVCCFSSESRRCSFINETNENLKKAGIIDFVRIKLKYEGNNRAVIFPFADYIVIGKIPENHRGLVIEQNIIPVDGFEEVEDQEWALEQFILGHFPVFANNEYDECLISNGVRFVSLLNSGWIVEECDRFGDKFFSLVFPDEILLKEVSAVETINDVYFSVLTTPKLGMRWRKINEQLENATIGMSFCFDVLHKYLEQIENSETSSQVLIDIYNPSNVIMSLVCGILYGNDAYFPQLTIFKIDELGKPASMLKAVLVWDRETKVMSPQKIFKLVMGGDIERWFLAQTMNDVWEYEQDFLDIHGLSYMFIETNPMSDDGKYYNIELEDGQLTRKEIDLDGLCFLKKYISENWDYVCDLTDYILEFTHGIDPLTHQLDGMAAKKAIYWCGDVTTCNVCGRAFGNILFDAEIPGLGGIWGLICRHCFTFLNGRLGLGLGQRYDLQHDGRWLKVAG